MIFNNFKQKELFTPLTDILNMKTVSSVIITTPKSDRSIIDFPILRSRENVYCRSDNIPSLTCQNMYKLRFFRLGTQCFACCLSYRNSYPRYSWLEHLVNYSWQYENV